MAENKMAQMSSEVKTNSKLSPELHTELTSGLNINLRLPPELLTMILHYLPFADLKNALLVCRLTKKLNIMRLICT